MLLNVVYAKTVITTPAPPFPHVFAFLYYFRRSSLSFCSSEVWNTALESLGKHESMKKKIFKIGPLQPLEIEICGFALVLYVPSLRTLT